MIDRRAVKEYLSLIGERELPLNLFEVTDMEDSFPIERVNRVLNRRLQVLIILNNHKGTLQLTKGNV